MEVDEVMELYDSFWFELRIFKKQPVSSNPSNFEDHPNHEIEENPENPSRPEILRIPTRHTMSMSDELSSNTSTFSSDSVLHRPKLSTIISGKEAREIGNPKQIYSEEEPQKKVERRRRRKKTSESKSWTDLQRKIKIQTGFQSFLGYKDWERRMIAEMRVLMSLQLQGRTFLKLGRSGR